LKLLDPEKVKSLTPASRLHVSGGVKQTPTLHQTSRNKPPPRSGKNSLPRSSRKRTGIGSRRENINPSGAVKILQSDDVDPRGHELCHRMKQLLLDDQDGDESRSDNAQPGDGPHDARTSGQTVQDGAGGLEDTNTQDNEKSSHPANLPATAGQIDEEERGRLAFDSNSPPTGGVQEQEGYTESQPSYHQKDNHGVTSGHDEGPPAQPSSPENVVDGLYRPAPDGEPTTATSSHQSDESSLVRPEDTGTSDQKSQPASLEGENVSASNSADGDGCSVISGPDLPPDEQNASKTGSQDLRGHHWSGSYDVVRQSQGVLVLTRSTDEDAVFIPKLKFEFTPDNSIDWTRPGSNNGGAPGKNALRVLDACTPRGPTFSKSMLKKASMLYSQDDVPAGSSESALRFSGAGDTPSLSAGPPQRIVDLSISFQGKYEEQEIPADVPKILLTEEDYDED
ncbi:uncharacterized protein ACNLHF_004387, partial [Anomaloglossus baeobatrachus]|uniref:uncharacterized protein LOC142260432 n=2 Tax=Anomaloglossus baeobatrachus TaxID=238106 RepID=UPI003F5012D3